MSPTIRDGDILVVSRVDETELTTGTIVVLRAPSPGVKLAVKRIAGHRSDCSGLRWRPALHAMCDGLKEDEVLVVGDNPSRSRDSREYGVVSRSAVVGRVAFVIWPRLHPPR